MPATEAGALFLQGAAELGQPLSEELNGPNHEGWTTCEQAVDRGVRQSGWNYLNLAAHRPNLHILTHAQATKVPHLPSLDSSTKEQASR